MPLSHRFWHATATLALTKKTADAVAISWQVGVRKAATTTREILREQKGIDPHVGRVRESMNPIGRKCREIFCVSFSFCPFSFSPQK